MFEKQRFQNQIEFEESRSRGAVCTDTGQSGGRLLPRRSEHNTTVLIVDGAQVNRSLLKTIFSPLYHIQEAGCGREALNILHAIPDVSVIILNLNLPDMSGFDVMREMWRDAQIASIPVIVVIDCFDAENEVRALQIGASDVIQKPFREEALRLRVRNLIGWRESSRIKEQNLIYKLRLQQQEEILRLAQYDERTGIYNRQTFYRKAARLLQNNPKIPYLIVRADIDHFKVYNDVYGTEAGDKFLEKVGEICRKICPPNMIYAHYDADHFVFCFPESMPNTHLMIEQTEKEICRIQPDFDFILRFGVYRVEDLCLSVNLMCDRALLALHTIKGGYTKNVAYYCNSMRAALMEEQEIVSEMANSLEKGQFTIVLQPQYDHISGAIFGAEALVRWHHPRKGEISPAKFIPIFERNGFITKMDEYVWDQVCALLAKWRAQGRNIVPISINVSRIDVYNPRLVHILNHLITTYDLEPALLRLEITESAYMKNPEQLIEVVKRLRAEGFLVEIDDFGSGYSSLNTLKDVPTDVLKLDMKFLSSTENNDASGIILTSVVRMARWLDLPVIAEGVENAQQADYLKTIGCSLVQGYLYGKPMPPDEFEKLLDRSQTRKVIPGDKILGSFPSEELWSSEFQISTAFNRRMSAAGIFEVHNNKLEALRVNDRFFESFHIRRSRFKIRRDDLLNYILPKDKPVLMKAMQKAMHLKTEVECETRWHISGSSPVRIRSQIRVIACSANEYLLCAKMENMTEVQKSSEDD